MRKLRVAVITSVAGGVPVLFATMLHACGSDDNASIDDADRRDVVAVEHEPGFRFDANRPPLDAPEPTTCSDGREARVVELPDAGLPATPDQLCAAQPSTVESTASARVTLKGYANATGFVALPADIEGVIVGTPSVAVIDAAPPQLASMTVTNMTKVTGGFQFTAGWAETLPSTSCFGTQTMTVKATFDIACADGGTKTVEARTRIDICDGSDGSLAWVSSGDQCCDCVIIAEMAPSPIVSDKTKDDLPLARVVRLRVVELARAGRQVLLFAENDAGPELELDWNVSGGSLERIDADLMLWTLPDDDASPFGQVAVWNDAGAAVENFAWGTA
jgi:hypothetical protein